MDHSVWDPNWPSFDLRFDSDADDSMSNLDLSRGFGFDLGGPSAVESDPGVRIPNIAAQDGRFVAGFWSEDEPDLAAEVHRKPKAPRKPEIPGYEILGELGRGAMGVVYRARQIRLNRMVALKMILAGDHAGPDTLARFIAEAETIARLRHPHIVQIFAIGDWEGRPYVELEYVEGGSLGSKLDGTPWPPRAAARLLESLARAAAEAHRLGIVHRDLKPANILMTEAGEPKISDFGLAKTLEEDSGLTRTESILGSPNYMAPEQADGRARDVGPAADIYALGANLYELLTGRPPFLAPTILATLDLVKNSDPVHPRKLQPLLDRDLETICLKCLAKEPGQRYETADALADDIQAFLADEPIMARRPPPWERSWKWVRRRPSTAALMVVISLAIITASVAISMRRREIARIDAVNRQNIVALKGQIDRYIFLGGEAIRRGEWEGGRNQLTSAMALIRSEPKMAGMAGTVNSMLELIGQKIADQQRLESARGRFVEFQKLYDEAVFYRSDYTGLDPEANIRASRESAVQALAKFGHEFGPTKDKVETTELAPDPKHFDAREISKIHAGCYELTLLLAGSMSNSLPGENPSRQEWEALELLDAAGKLGTITPALHLCRASILERSGDRRAAVDARKLAEEVPATSWSAVDHFLAGEQAYRRKDFKRAIESFRYSLAIQPDRFWAQYFLAVCLLKEHRPSEAQAALIACQSRRPGFAWTYLLKGFAEGELREFDLAEEDFRRANELRLNNQERYVMLVNRGVMRIRRGRDQDAVADLSEAIALKPDQFEAYINLSSALQKIGRWDESVATLGRAIDGHPREPVLYRSRSQAYRLQSRTNDALKDLQRAIDLLPQNDPALVSDLLEVAVILQQDGRSEESLDACERALRLKPNRPDVHRVRGIALMMLKRYDEAIGSFDTCLARGGNSVALFEARGLALASQGSYERALADYTMALNLGRATPSLLANRGWAYLLSGAPAPALRDFDEAIRIDSSNGHALSGRALTNVQLRKTQEAIDDAEASIRLNPEDARQVYNAARVYCQAAVCLESSTQKNGMMMAAAGRYRSEAIKQLTRAIELCPGVDRSRFWSEVVCKDSSLESIRRWRSYIDLGYRATARWSSANPVAGETSR